MSGGEGQSAESDATDRCVVCAASVRPQDGGLCNDHKYDEQVAAMLAPVVRATDDLPSADPLAELFWLHRLFGDQDDDPICGCGAAPPEDAWEVSFGQERWHDEHLAAAVRGTTSPASIGGQSDA